MTNRRPTIALDQNDVDALLGACSRSSATGARMRAWIAFAFRTGLRVAETLSLRPRDLDLDKGQGRVLAGKGGKDRVFGIAPDAVAAVEVWLAKRAKLAAAKGWNPRTAPVFCKPDGTAPSNRAVELTLHRLAEKAGLDKPCRPHGLRAGAATALVSAGHPLNVVQGALGHERVDTTARYVARLSGPEVVRAMRSLGNPEVERPEDIEKRRQEKLALVVDRFAILPEEKLDAILDAMEKGGAA